MKASLIKTRTILRYFADRDDGCPMFTAAESNEGEAVRNHGLILDLDVWDDIGRPTIITVTIEPGDLLND